MRAITRWRLAAALIAAMASGACGGARTPTESPAPMVLPDIHVEAAYLGALLGPAFLTEPVGEPVVDELLASPVLRDPEFSEAVAAWVDYWQRLAKPWFPDFLRRMGSFEMTVDSALAERRLPASLRFLPLIESGYSPSANSHASAVGMWQFMAGTAGEFGMEVGPFLDQRRDPYLSTEAAVGFLAELHDDFDSWFLALAAYNGGPNRTRRILSRYAPLAQPSDSLFWALRRHWPVETREFVPKLVAAIIVGGSPERYGYLDTQRNPPLRFEEVTVPDATTFDVLAFSAEVDEEEIRALNPQLFRGFTPPGRSVSVRVPEGTAATFERNYADVPANERMTVVEHIVSSGETLSHIAVRYGVSLVDLQAANPTVRARYLRVGARLMVPIVLGRRRTS